MEYTEGDMEYTGGYGVKRGIWSTQGDMEYRGRYGVQRGDIKYTRKDEIEYRGGKGHI